MEAEGLSGEEGDRLNDTASGSKGTEHRHQRGRSIGIKEEREHLHFAIVGTGMGKGAFCHLDLLCA